MLQVTAGQRSHGHEYTAGLKAVRANADGEVAILARKCREHNRAVAADGLLLRAIRLEAVAVIGVQHHRYGQNEVVLIIFIYLCAVVKLRVNVNLYESGSACQLVCVFRHTVQLVGHIEIPRKRYLLRVQLPFIIEASFVIR